MFNYREKSRLVVALLTLAGFVVACESSSPPKRLPAKKTATGVDTDGDGIIDSKPGSDAGDSDDGDISSDGVSTADAAGEKVKPLSDDAAIAFLKDNCIACHNAKDGSVKSFWAIEPEGFNKDEFITSAMAPTVYYALVMRSKDIVGGKPAAMPPAALDDDRAHDLLRLLAWFRVEAASAVATAHARYGKGSDDGADVGVILDYKCDKPATFREYLRRVTNDAFGREPKIEELALAENGPDEPTTRKDREAIAKKMFEDPMWKTEFLDKGLKKFSDKLSGSGDIKPLDPVLSQVQADDLKNEFYQILRQSYETTSYRDILLSNKVMVSENTAALYGCAAPPAGTWASCDMQAPRGSYFTTFSYLRSKPSSFLIPNNNYGRAALMYFVIRGDVFKAQFDQSGGDDGVKATPDCLTSKDKRGKKGDTGVAPFGSLAVPSFANLCQSCHIQRQMAAGSILYRNYDKVGNLYGSDRPVDQDPDFGEATATDMVNSADGREEFLDAAFLTNLLTGTGEQACVPGGDGHPDKVLMSVADLATYIIGDGAELAGGLARHLPRAFSNLGNTSEELIVRVNKAWDQGGGKLGPVFQAYFSSETYACSKR